MCGIVGWVDFARDLTRERPELAAMTATMAPRGPDQEGIWLAEHVGFGHRRLSVIDLVGGRQPMLLEEDGKVTLALTYSGEVYNFKELREELVTRGHVFRTSSDTEVVLHAYREWGEAMVDRLNGMYAFGIWDARAEKLVLIRDRMGIKPLFYHPTPEGVIFGSEPKAILANRLAERAIDLDGMRELFGFIKTPERSIFAGMSEVGAGQMIVVDRSGPRKRTYWKLEAREHRDDLETTVAHVRDLLDEIIERQLVSDVPLCTLLSGGLDSSVITALAARSRQRAGSTITSYLVDFSGYAERFAADPARDTADTPFAHELAKFVGSDHQDVVLSPERLSDPAVREKVVRAYDQASPLADACVSLYLLFAAVRRDFAVALSGETADEVFGGYRWFHDPQTRDRAAFPWLEPDRSYELGYLDRGVFDRLDMATYRNDRYSEALANVPHLPGETPEEHRSRELSYLALTRYLRIHLDRKDRMSMASGLEVRVPFADHRLVEYCFNIPWKLKTFDGREKSVLRAAMKDRLPTSILERRKAPYPLSQDPTYHEKIRTTFATLVADKDAPIAPLLDTSSATAWLDRAKELPRTRFALEFAIQLDRFVRTSGVSLRA
jgi:asparagine synthase (glutamine-hydrolysing)